MKVFPMFKLRDIPDASPTISTIPLNRSSKPHLNVLCTAIAVFLLAKISLCARKLFLLSKKSKFLFCLLLTCRIVEH